MERAAEPIPSSVTGADARSFPIVRAPGGRARPILVSVPHYGTAPLPEVRPEDYAERRYTSFPAGYTDRFAADLYGDAHRLGATVLATPYSRLFVDVNRRRDDFEIVDGAARSKRGVVRTHTVNDDPVFAEPLEVSTVEHRLTRYYDPYHRVLRQQLRALERRHERVLLLDAHTASEKGLREYDVVVSTARGRTAHDAAADRIDDIFKEAGFRTGRDVKGYAGGYIVRRYGRARHPSVDAVQLEVNTRLLLTVSRQQLFRDLDRGVRPRIDAGVAARLRACVEQVIVELE